MSDRKFGLQLALVFVILIALGSWRHWNAVLLTVAGITALVLVMMALASPTRLTRVRAVWMRGSVVLGRLLSPVVLSLMYWIIIVPAALVMRLFQRDALDINRRRRSVVWSARMQTEFEPDFFERQW